MTTVSRTRLATASILAIVFGAGGMVGAAVYSLVVPSQRADAADVRMAPATQPAESTAVPRTRIVDQVGLTRDQKWVVDSIVEFRRENASQLWREWRATFDALSDSTRAEIQKILTPEQRVLYDSLRRERDRRRNEGPGERELWEEWEEWQSRER
ncbi:MAG: hypothetical protein HY701_10455 [Gemmatimonadetes bacterium]|nr:hypothetical protein [Gemmatimonadota bacterium]